MKNLYSKSLFIAWWGVAVGFLCCAPAFAVDWTITDLGPGGAYGINNRGQVVGWYGSGDYYYAFLHDGTQLRTLSSQISLASGVNMHGHVTGWVSDGNNTFAFLSDGSGMGILGEGFGYGINDRGQVVGVNTSSASGGGWQAVIYDGGLRPLGTLGGSTSLAYAINNNSQVVGYSSTADGLCCTAFLYSGGMMSLGFAGSASGISNNGQITGIYGNNQAFLRSATGLSLLGTIGGSFSEGTSVNIRGQAVGYSALIGDTASTAFLYDGRMRNLSNLPEVAAEGWSGLAELYWAAINDSGQIVGTGNRGGAYRAYRLHPQTTSRYMRTVNSVALFNLGCAQTNQSGLQILHFGRPRYNGTDYGASLFQRSLVTPIPEIEAAVRYFLNGYYVCGGRGFMTVGVGTSNDGSQTTFAHGQAWGRMVARLNDYVANYRDRLAVVGASDIEMNFNRPASSRAWVDGYASTSPVMYYNYGDAAGCPRCNNGWTMEDVWYVSWGNAARPLPVPQIYHTGGAQTRQWQAVTTYGRTTHGTEPFIPAALTQWQACRDPGRSCDPTIRNTPVQAWYQLMNMLHGVVGDPTRVQNILYSSDITWQN